MSYESRVLLDMATLADVDDDKVRARKLREVATYIEDLELGKLELDKRILSLEEGECRFHCRMRKSMWMEGLVYGYTWNGKGSFEEQYKKWRESDGGKSIG